MLRDQPVLNSASQRVRLLRALLMSRRDDGAQAANELCAWAWPPSVGPTSVDTRAPLRRNAGTGRAW